jgi:hypothetical protein
MKSVPFPKKTSHYRNGQKKDLLVEDVEADDVIGFENLPPN